MVGGDGRGACLFRKVALLGTKLMVPALESHTARGSE